MKSTNRNGRQTKTIMQIEIVSSAPSAAPDADPVSATSDEATGSGSFADLLDAVADGAIESPVDEDGAEDTSTDEWITAPVIVPFIPVIPVEAIDGQIPAVVNVEAEEEGTSIDAIDGAVTATPVVGPFDATGESHNAGAAPLNPTTGAPRIDAAAGSTNGEAAIEGPPVTNADVPAVEMASDVDSVPQRSPSESTSEPMEKVDTALETQQMSAAADPTTTEAMANTEGQRAQPEGSASTGTSVTNDPPAEPTRNHKGVAARLARALERAAEASAPHRAETASGESGHSFDQGAADHRPSFGDWLLEQLPQVANAGAQSPSTPAFSLVAPAHHDARIASVIASAETSLIPGAPLPREHDVTMQILQSLRLQFRDGIGEAVLKLKPEHLGSVAISLRVENGGLKANVQADLPAVRQWLESQQDTLRSALAEHGLRLDRFDIEPDGQRQSSPDDPRDRASRKRQAQRGPRTDQPVFEVVV